MRRSRSPGEWRAPARRIRQFVARGGEDARLGNGAPPMAGAARRAATPRQSSAASRSGRPDRWCRYRCRVRARRWRPARAPRLLSACVRLPAAACATGCRDARQPHSLAHALGKMMRDALGQPSRIHEDQRGAMLAGQLGDAVIDLVPHFVAWRRRRVRWRGFPRRGRARRRWPVSTIDRHADEPLPVRNCATSSMGFCVAERPMRTGSRAGRVAPAVRAKAPDARRACRRRRRESHRRSRSPRRASIACSALRGEQNVERLGRGDQDVRRPLQHRRRSCISVSPVRTAARIVGISSPRCAGQRLNLAERHLEVFLDVVAERLQRRDVEDFGAVLQPAVERLAHQPVDAGQKRRQGLARAGGRAKSACSAGENGRPAFDLRLRRRAEARGTTREQADAPTPNVSERRQSGCAALKKFPRLNQFRVTHPELSRRSRCS